MPRILVVIDDLISLYFDGCPSAVKLAVQRLMCRTKNKGIHLLIASQVHFVPDDFLYYCKVRATHFCNPAVATEFYGNKRQTRAWTVL